MFSIRAELRLKDRTADAGRLVPIGTPLTEVAPFLDQDGSRHLLIMRGPALMGVVTSDQVRDRLRTINPVERRRWESSPIESLLATPLLELEQPRDPPDGPVATTGSIPCVSHIAGDRVVAFSTSDDVFVSWKQFQPILDRATTDAVTHLPPRSYFETGLAREVERARRWGAPLAVLLIDVDHFKRVNDLCGHSLGDAVLHIVAGCVRRSLRSYDVVARYAGDEFAAVCPGCSASEIDRPIRRIQSSIEQLAVPTELTGLRIGLSIGAAVAPVVDESVTADGLMEVADQCLYAAKADGRNCAYQMTVGPRRECKEATRVESRAPEGARVHDAGERRG
jgi:diguanylate cyclase (GGDEF)-like protein